MQEYFWSNKGKLDFFMEQFIVEWMTRDKKENQEITEKVEKCYVIPFRWNIKKHQAILKDIGKVDWV